MRRIILKIKESGEMYLETILLLSKMKSCVRSNDVVKELHYSKSSVSRGVNVLRKRGYITINTDGCIHFTIKGLHHAQMIFDKHKVLTEHLVRLGVDKTIAEADACRIEHVISDVSFEAIKKTDK